MQGGGEDSINMCLILCQVVCFCLCMCVYVCTTSVCMNMYIILYDIYVVLKQFSG